MIISSHSHSHKNINLLNLKNQFEDIKTSKKILEKLIAKKYFSSLILMVEKILIIVRQLNILKN